MTKGVCVCYFGIGELCSFHIQKHSLRNMSMKVCQNPSRSLLTSVGLSYFCSAKCKRSMINYIWITCIHSVWILFSKFWNDLESFCYCSWCQVAHDTQKGYGYGHLPNARSLFAFGMHVMKLTYIFYSYILTFTGFSV